MRETEREGEVVRICVTKVGGKIDNIRDVSVQVRVRVANCDRELESECA